MSLKVNVAHQTIGNLFGEIALDKPEYLTFSTPPLALVVAMIESGKGYIEIVEILLAVESNNVESATVVTDAHRQQADEVYNYFAKRHTMRRLKGEYISQWMTKVEELCENRQRINKESLTLLVTMPKFHQGNLEVDPLVRDYKSLKADRTVENFKETLAFVKKIKRRAKTSKYNDYYWKNNENHLVRIRLETGSPGNAAWDCIAKVGNITLESAYCYTTNIPGYDFYVLESSPAAIMEVTLL